MGRGLLFSLILELIGLVLWFESGPHATRGAWILLAMMLILGAVPVVFAWALAH